MKILITKTVLISGSPQKTEKKKVKSVMVLDVWLWHSGLPIMWHAYMYMYACIAHMRARVFMRMRICVYVRTCTCSEPARAASIWPYSYHRNPAHSPKQSHVWRPSSIDLIRFFGFAKEVKIKIRLVVLVLCDKRSQEACKFVYVCSYISCKW